MPINNPAPLQLSLQILTGLLLGVLVGILAYRKKALSRSGAWAAALVGGLVFGSGGIPWTVLLLTFFISSSLLSKTMKERQSMAREKYAKGSQRDAGQVFANGGLAAILALLHGLWPDQAWVWVSFAGCLAAVNADTWATELGVLSPTLPRLITSGKTVEMGTSGGVTLMGYLAALAGAATIGLGAAAFSPGSPSLALVIVIVTLAGLAGTTFDSILGATVQVIYRCPSCRKETERHPIHGCGTETTQVRGQRWLNNDVVNFACSLAGAVVAVAAYLLLG